MQSDDVSNIPNIPDERETGRKIKTTKFTLHS